jgi:hypothetical protein
MNSSKISRFPSMKKKNQSELDPNRMMMQSSSTMSLQMPIMMTLTKSRNLRTLIMTHSNLMRV